MEKDIKDSYSTDPENREQDIHEAPLDAVPKSRWERSWPVIAAGSGTSVQAVNQLLKQFGQMQKMMRQLQQGKMPSPEQLMRGL